MFCFLHRILVILWFWLATETPMTSQLHTMAGDVIITGNQKTCFKIVITFFIKRCIAKCNNLCCYRCPTHKQADDRVKEKESASQQTMSMPLQKRINYKTEKDSVNSRRKSVKVSFALSLQSHRMPIEVEIDVK